MFEFRWQVVKDIDDVLPNRVIHFMDNRDVTLFNSRCVVLQYRYLRWRIDASGAINVTPPEWSEWQDVIGEPQC